MFHCKLNQPGVNVINEIKALLVKITQKKFHAKNIRNEKYFSVIVTKRSCNVNDSIDPRCARRSNWFICL